MSSKQKLLHLLISTASCAVICGSAQAQQSADLDITIQVIEQGESPAGFINRLAIPSMEMLIEQSNTGAAQIQIDAIEQMLDVTTELANDTTQVANDSVREIISIDGVVNVVVDPDTDTGNPVLPPAIVDILDPALPLVEPIVDVVDQVGDIVGGLPTLPLVDGGIVDSLSQDIDASVQGTLDIVTEDLVPLDLPGLDTPITDDLPAMDALGGDIPALDTVIPLDDATTAVPSLNDVVDPIDQQLSDLPIL